MATKGAVNFKSFLVLSTNGPPAKMNMNEGKNVNHVTKVAANAPDQNKLSDPNTALAYPPINPTNVTTMMRGPGVVSPNAKPSII